MADRIKTIGLNADYADPILWAASEGNINDGDRAVGIMLNDILISTLFRPNQAFINGGLLKGNVIVTGEPLVGRELTSSASTRIILSPSDNLDFEDLYITAGGGGTSQSYAIQAGGSGTFNRVIMDGDESAGSINIGSSKTVTLNNCVMKYLVSLTSAPNAEFNCANVLLTGRALVRGNPSILKFKNAISIASDWLLGAGTDAGATTLVNYARIKENAPANNFGPGSDNYIVNYDATNDFVDLAGGDYRIKASSPLATAGENGELLGPFLEYVAPTGFKIGWITTYSGVVV